LAFAHALAIAIIRQTELFIMHPGLKIRGMEIEWTKETGCVPGSRWKSFHAKASGSGTTNRETRFPDDGPPSQDPIFLSRELLGKVDRGLILHLELEGDAINPLPSGNGEQFLHLLWELLLLSERGRVRIGDEPRRWIPKTLAQIPAQEAVVTVEVAIRSREILPAHPDPVDRFLVATALVYGLTFVTADKALIEAIPCPLLANR
jgi:hypothetical protein